MPLIPALGRQSQADLLSLRSILSSEQVSGQPVIHRETLFQNKNNKTKNHALGPGVSTHAMNLIGT